MVRRVCATTGLWLWASAAPAVAFPVTTSVRVHSRGETREAATTHIAWTIRGSELGQDAELDYAALPVVGLSVRGGERVVVRLRKPARSVAVRLARDGGGQVRRRARALSPKGTVWRVRLPGPIGRARLMLVGVRYRPIGRVVVVGTVVYETAVCATVFCRPVDAIA
jgi:hypothetical protein